MQRLQLVAISLSLAVATGGCVSAGSHVSAAPRRNSDVLTHAEMERCAAVDPLDAVERLRPGWLRSKSRRGTRPGYDGLPIVYAQNLLLGSIQELTSLRIEGIQEIRYVSSVDATTRWGMGHTGGVIEVIWVDQPTP